MQPSDFSKGQCVRYVPHTQPVHGRDYTGRTAKVVRPVKSRNIVTITWDDERPDPRDNAWYDAAPENLELI
jgi:hypothetical protein